MKNYSRVSFEFNLRHGNLFALGFDVGFQLVDVGTDDAMNLFAVFEEDECWHRFHVVLLRDSLGLVDIDFDENNTVLEIAIAPVFDFRRDA